MIFAGDDIIKIVYSVFNNVITVTGKFVNIYELFSEW